MKVKEKNISMKELCHCLSISEATGRNWLRLGRLVPDRDHGGKPYFSQKYVKQLQKELKHGDTKTLKSRRNKKYVAGNGIYASYLTGSSRNYAVISSIVRRQNRQPPEEMRLREILGECALQLLGQAAGKEYDFSDDFLFHYRQGKINLGEYDILVRELLGEQSNRQGACGLRQEHLFSGIQYCLEPENDVLGMLYLSLKNLGARKAAGAYYTPACIVQKLLKDLKIDETAAKHSLKILDPCCGTGNFLLQLSRNFRMEELYGGDVDLLAVQIARINLAIACRDVPVPLIRERIQVRDFLMGEDGEQYDVILGNPPWGSSREHAQNQVLRKNFLTGTGGEAYDLFLEQSLRRVKPGGLISFVLPEAVLYVKSHEKIRSLITEQVQIQSLSYLGNVFDKVQCPAVILNMYKTGRTLKTCGMNIDGEHGKFQIKINRTVTKERFNFHMTDQEYQILDKIEQRKDIFFLSGQADFALGIVTGDNKKYVKKEKSTGTEVVLKGCDIGKYAIQEGKQYLAYEPQYFQQTAPEHYYRAKEKLFYRFIGKELVFAYDDRQRLSLNSCNILIPRIPGVDIKYVLAVLNSRTAQFIYERKFRSMKVLRSYLEQIPIPAVSLAQQKEIILLAEKMMSVSDPILWQETYHEADRKIAAAYGLAEAEYSILQKPSALPGQELSKQAAAQ